MQNQEAVKASLEEQLYERFEEQMQENLKMKVEEVKSQKTKVLFNNSYNIVRLTGSSCFG